MQQDIHDLSDLGTKLLNGEGGVDLGMVIGMIAGLGNEVTKSAMDVCERLEEIQRTLHQIKLESQRR